MGNSEQTKKAILEAARHCFALKGVAGTSTREIAKTAGVTQPLILHYFASKDSLYSAVIQDIIDSYKAEQKDQWTLPPGDLRFITHGLPVLFWWLGEQQENLRLAAWARLERQPQSALFESIFQHVRQQLLAAQKKGHVQKDVDVESVLFFIDSTFKGFWEQFELFQQLSIRKSNVDKHYLKTSLEMLYKSLLSDKAQRKAMAHLEKVLSQR